MPTNSGFESPCEEFDIASLELFREDQHMITRIDFNELVALAEPICISGTAPVDLVMRALLRAYNMGWDRSAALHDATEGEQ